MKDLTNYNKSLQFCEKENQQLRFLFWLKVCFGIVGGITHYYIQRILFLIGSFDVHYLLRGLFINTVIFAYISFIHFLIVSVLSLLKKKFPNLIPNNMSVWRYSLKFSFTFIIIFIVSASLAFYIGS
ncbi:MAG: hypothetical protein ACFE9S_16740 [Candidatus Hermodarchaeota archaeon]